MKFYLDLPSDIDGLEKKIEVSSVTFDFTQNRVVMAGNHVYQVGDKILADRSQLGYNPIVQTDAVSVGAISPEAATADALEAVKTIAQAFYTAKMATPAVDENLPETDPN